jgi:23S rRNA pseudouridine2605 synthase
MSTRSSQPTDQVSKKPKNGRTPGRQPAAAIQSADTVDQGERLQKYLAHAGIASRRHAEQLIAAGAVTVNGQVVSEQGSRVHPDSDEVCVHGEPVRPANSFIYILLNKPAGTMSTVSDPEGRRTVLDLLPQEWRRQRIYPIGRLDWDTEGLVLLTNDGKLTLHLTHPRYALPKEYHALVAREPSPSELRQLADGVLLSGHRRPTAPARLWIIGRQGAATWIGLEIHEGRNRQVRRMLEAISCPVLQLRRVRVGPIRLGNEPPGSSRRLTQTEVTALYQASGL